MQPYKQGKLDYLCGVYSIVNAVRKLTGANGDESHELFIRIINYLDENKDLREIIINTGVSRTMMSNIFSDVINQDVVSATPFWSDDKIDLGTFWEEMVNFIDHECKRTIIICHGCKSNRYDHWTVVDSISDKKILFFDSYGTESFFRRECTTKKATKVRPYILNPTHTYFISKPEND